MWPFLFSIACTDAPEGTTEESTTNHDTGDDSSNTIDDSGGDTSEVEEPPCPNPIDVCEGSICTLNLTNPTLWTVSGTLTYMGAAIPVEGVDEWHVYWVRDDGLEASAKVANDGSWTATVPSGVYDLFSAATSDWDPDDDYNEVNWPDFKSYLRVRTGVTVDGDSNLDIDVPAPLALVTLEVTGDFKAMWDSQVILTEPTGTAWGQSDIDVENGTFVAWSGVDYEVRADAQVTSKDDTDCSWDDLLLTSTFKVTSEAAQRLEVELYTVSGTITHRGGALPEDVTVYATDSSGTGYAKTGTLDGNYACVIPSGTYSLHTSYRGEQIITENLVVNSDAEASAEIDLIWLDGTLSEIRGLPDETDVSVKAEIAGIRTWSGLTHSSGLAAGDQYGFWLAPGVYDIDMEAGGGSYATTTAVAALDAEEDTALDLVGQWRSLDITDLAFNGVVPVAMALMTRRGSWYSSCDDPGISYLGQQGHSSSIDRAVVGDGSYYYVGYWILGDSEGDDSTVWVSPDTVSVSADGPLSLPVPAYTVTGTWTGPSVEGLFFYDAIAGEGCAASSRLSAIADDGASWSTSLPAGTYNVYADDLLIAECIAIGQ